ncbi:MAG: bifunctional oligoribonuclease/PAP phosphatase NrnA [Bacteroidales bacterium]|nr:bifunctional oligoribonuclease/PAP phosphatase NrnA [Bacteroidales bacterium]
MKSRVSRGKSKIKKLLTEGSRKIVILTHVNPDGDAIGSSLALCRVLKKMGHIVNVITPNVYPSFLQWMPGNSEITVFYNALKKARLMIQEAEIIFCLDFNDLTRIKQVTAPALESTAHKILIDHHPTQKYFTPMVYCDVNVSSTAELIYDFICSLGFRNFIDLETATCIYTGMMTDTGCFSYNSSNPYTYRVVAKLLEMGLDKDYAYAKVYDNFSGSRMRLLGYVLNEKMEIFEEYATAILSLTREEQKRFRFQAGDSEGFVNYPLSIKNIKFSVLFVEKEDHVKLSLRSKGSFQVNRFAELHFNGGGHPNASGGEMHAPMQEVLKKFRELLPQYKNELADEKVK